MIIGTITRLIGDDEKKYKCFSTTIDSYQLYFRYEPVDYYISHYISLYSSLDIKRGAVYLGEEEFFLVPESVKNTEFERNYGNYFSGYRFFLIKPNDILMSKIFKFNKQKKINKMKKKYGKAMEGSLSFYMDELIENSDFVFIFPEYPQDLDSEILIFFESNFINSIDFIKNYFQSKDIFIVDTTNKSGF